MNNEEFPIFFDFSCKKYNNLPAKLYNSKIRRITMPPELSDQRLKKLPKARTKDLVVQETGDEVLVYDMTNDRAHHLNKTMSIVWRNCDGKTDHLSVLMQLSKEIKKNVGSDFLALAIKELDEAELLEPNFESGLTEEISRRKVLLRYALPAISAPVVMSLVTPVSAMQTSCLGLGEICSNQQLPCCPGSACTVQEGCLSISG